MTTNCIKFTSADFDTAKGVGSISTLTFDLDITVEPVASANPMAPTHRVLGRSPRGKLVECGGIWKKQNKETGADYYTLTIRDHGFNANLGKAANQDDLSLQAVIPWGLKDVTQTKVGRRFASARPFTAVNSRASRSAHVVSSCFNRHYIEEKS
ncbi:DUF736 family protein [Tritonibacter mobilis]|nr:DUF736 family protein [Tritonibacter mobilis]